MTPTDIQFLFDWDDPGGAAGAELRATWARLEIRIGDQAVSRVHDLRTRSTRDYLYLPLYPLAEWLVLHWWHLLREIGNPERSDYWRRHDLRFAGEGFALPSLRLMPQGRYVQLEWMAACNPVQPVEFIGTGKAMVPTQALERSLRTLIEAVIGRLVAVGIDGTLLQDEWQSLGALDREEREYCEVVAALGLDPFALDDAQASGIIDMTARVPAHVLSEFLPVADADGLAFQINTLCAAIDRVRALSGDLQLPRRLKKQLGGFGAPGPTPWVEGYEAARRVRAELGRSDAGPGLFDELALSGPDVVLKFGDSGDSNAFFDAIGGTNRVASPGFVVSACSDEAVRFAICRGFFEYLAAPDGQPVIVNRSRSLAQARNRAFAAEFLAPAESLRQRIGSGVIREDRVIELAREFGVGQQLVRHQLENHRIVRIVDDW